MAAHKKGQAWSGPYTHSKTIVSDASVTDASGNYIEKPRSEFANLNEPKNPEDNTAGLSAKLPKK
jgi:hypothetical protein